MASSFVSHQARWHNKRASIKGYSTPRDFSLIESYKLNFWNNIFEAFSTAYKANGMPILQIMYENYYQERLAKISTCLKYSIDA